MRHAERAGARRVTPVRFDAVIEHGGRVVGARLRASRARRKRETACGGSVEATVFCGVRAVGNKGVEAGKTDTSGFGQMPGLSRLCQFQC